jgi:hypothetical protein
MDPFYDRMRSVGYIPLPEAAKLLGMSPGGESLRMFRRRGIEVVSKDPDPGKRNKRHAVSLEDVERYLAEQKEEPPLTLERLAEELDQLSSRINSLYDQLGVSYGD